jgi:protein-S-isoprenylcysteine O-methyltransferase Ste14
MFIRGTRILLILCAYLLVCALGYLGFITYQHNLTGWFLILAAIGYGLGGPYLLWSNLKKVGVQRQERRDLSFWLILPGFLVVFYASPLEYIYLPGLLPFTHTGTLPFIGVGFITASLLLFGWARWALGGLYSGRVWVKTGHTLVQRGPYRILRHPAYAAYLLMSLGIAIGYSSLISLLAIPLFLLPGLIYRLNVEENLLLAEFGEQYIQYTHRTSRLFPGIW